MYEIYRKTASGYFEVVDQVDYPGGPDVVVGRVHDAEPNETILVRYVPGGGITVYKAEVGTKFIAQ